MKRVLVTGASGFIGRHSLLYLAAHGFEVHAVAHNGSLPKCCGMHWHRIDLLDGASMRELIAEVAPTHLLHFAWYAEPGKYQQSEQNLRWCQTGIELVRTFAEAGGQRAVFAGTCFEYDSVYGYCSEGLTPCVPATRYGASKLALAQLVTRFAPAGLSTAWGRIFHVYGPHEPEARLVSSVILSLLSRGRARCTHGLQVRDFMHVEDVASAFAAILSSDAAGIVNIGSGQPLTIRALVSTIAEAIGKPGSVDFGAIDAPTSDPPVLIPDVRRLHSEIGFTPRFALRDGILNTIAWWRRRQAASP